MKDPTGKWCYSTDQVSYSGTADTESDAHGQAQEAIDSDALEDGVCMNYEVAQCVHPLDMVKHSIGETVFENLVESVACEVGSDEDPIDLMEDQVAQLGQLVFDFVRAHAVVNWYGIKNPVKHQYITGSNASC